MKPLPRELMAVERLLEEHEPDGPSVALRSRTLDAILNVLPTDSLAEQQSLAKDRCKRRSPLELTKLGWLKILLQGGLCKHY